METIRSILVYLDTPILEITDRADWVGESLGISYLAASLRAADFNVTLIDGAGERLKSDEVFLRIMDSPPDFVGFSITHETIQEALKISRRLKFELPSIHICFGGIHATLAAEQILSEENCVDSIVRGEGEITIVEIVDTLSRGKSLKGIYGLWYRDKYEVICRNPDRPVFQNIDDLTFPSRDLSHDYHDRQKMPSARICTSRGCPWECAFCSTPALSMIQDGSKEWRGRSAENIVNEIQYLNKKFGYLDFSFIDDNCVLPHKTTKKRMHDIASEILRRKLKITIFMMCAALTFGPDDIELLHIMKQAGVERILLGIEAGSKATLKLYNKPTTAEKSMWAVNYLSTFGFGLLCSTISLHPYSSIEELRENYLFIKRLIDKPNVGMFAPYCTRLEVFPGANLFERVKQDNLLLTDKPYLDACSYSFVNPSVQFLAERLQEIEPKIVRYDWLIWDVRRFLLRTDNKFDNKVLLVDSKEKNECLDTIMMMNRINHSYFMAYLELANQQDLNRYEKEENKHIQELGRLAIILDQQFDLLKNKKRRYSSKQKWQESLDS